MGGIHCVRYKYVTSCMMFYISSNGKPVLLDLCMYKNGIFNFNQNWSIGRQNRKTMKDRSVYLSDSC